MKCKKTVVTSIDLPFSIEDKRKEFGVLINISPMHIQVLLSFLAWCFIGKDGSLLSGVLFSSHLCKKKLFYATECTRINLNVIGIAVLIVNVSVFTKTTKIYD